MPKSLEDYADEARKEVKEIPPEEVDRMINEGGWVVLDVREPDEYAEGHIPGAINCSRGFLEVKADKEHHKRDERLQDRNQKFICYCGGGYRSLLAAKTMKEMGFQDAVSMSGGWKSWQDEGRPEEQ